MRTGRKTWRKSGNLLHCRGEPEEEDDDDDHRDDGDVNKVSARYLEKETRRDDSRHLETILDHTRLY